MSSPPEAASGGFTGRSRQRKTRRGVLVADRVAASLISIGGVGTILAVLGVAVFLVWVVVPLFLDARVEETAAHDFEGGDRLLHVAVDEYQVLSWGLFASGALEVRRLDDGALRLRQQLVEPGTLTAASFLLRGELAVLGLADGTLRLAEIGFEPRILDQAAMPAAVIETLGSDELTLAVDHEDGVVQRTPTGQYRVQTLRAELGEEIPVADGPIVLVDHVARSTGPLIVALAEERGDPEAAIPPAPGYRLVAVSGEERSNFLTGETTLAFDPPVALPWAPATAAGDGPPAFLHVSGPGNDVYLAWRDGWLTRLDTGDLAAARVAEQGALTEDGATVTSMAFLLGNNTLIWGDSRGNLTGGFPVRLEEDFAAETLARATRDPDATTVFAKTKVLSTGGAAVTALDSSARSRMMLAGLADGEVRLYNVTNTTRLAAVELPVDGQAVRHVAMAPKEDGLLAASTERVVHARLDPRHPEASFAALFQPVWYEGYNQPQHLWQSSSGTDDFEMKLGLMPLVFGTIKATFYSMLFGVPLALLAAVYTSEFLHPRAKGVIKPGIELMASLPSVVLGFLAALVFAPYVEQVVPATLVGFVTVPLAFLLGAYLWQLLPARIAVRYGHWRFVAMLLALPAGIALAAVCGPAVEALLFGGDVMGWLAWAEGAPGAERFGNATGGWMILWVPLSALATALLFSRFVDPVMRRKSADWDRRRFALADFAKFAAGVAVTVALAFAVSYALHALGFDPRGSYVDTYVQRNALIVGFVMGFAIIPIIYTISEDALSTVPEHLRSASLGAGATVWQTAVRIVIPTAMSGLFSAMMVGLGRAVGETMIVLMAAGNTPVMEWNVFEGFRTLSANIAVELPEAVRNSTHYRTLFLAALVLFLLTFAVNTVAEVIRQRFRKRAYQL